MDSFLEAAWNDIKRGVNPKSNKLYFHISTKENLDEKELKPQIPSYITDPKNEINPDYPEDVETPRLCVSPSIEGCLVAILNIKRLKKLSPGLIFYVYTPEKPFSSYKHKTNKEIIKDKSVFDANITGEAWILEPCKLKFYGTIRINKITDLKPKKTVNNIPIGRFDIDWDWIVKPKVFERIGESSDVLVSNDEFFGNSEVNTYNASIPYDTVYFGTRNKIDGDIKLQNEELFVTPFISLSSIFAVCPKGDFKIPIGSYNIGYDEWNKPLEVLESETQPLKEVHISIQGEGYQNLEPYDLMSHGYVYEIDISKLKDKIYQHNWMDRAKEYLIKNVDKVKVKNRYDVSAICHISGSESDNPNLHVSRKVPSDFINNNEFMIKHSIPLDEESLKKYKNKCDDLKHGLKNFKLNENIKGQIWVTSEDKIIAYVICEKIYDKNTIVGIEIIPKYQNIISQLIDFSRYVYAATYSSINKKDKNLYDNFIDNGWVVYEETDDKYIMTCESAYMKESDIDYNCISYAMGVDDSVLALQSEGFEVVKEESEDDEDDCSYRVRFNSGMSDMWEDYIINNMKDTYWNEYINLDNMKITFMIKDGNFQKIINDNMKNDKELLSTLNRLCNGNFFTIKDLIYSCDFYRENIKDTYDKYTDDDNKLAYMSYAKNIVTESANTDDGYTLRPATESDSDNMYKWEMESIDKSLKNDKKIQQFIRNDVKKSIKDTKMIMKDGETIGMFTSCMIDDGEVRYIGEIFIVPEYRGRGIGSSILKSEIDKYNRIQLQVAYNNAKAIKLYKSLGFKIIKSDDTNKMHLMEFRKKPLRFYHIISKDVILDDKGLKTPEYVLNVEHNEKLYLKMTEKYRERLCKGWEIYPGRDPKSLTVQEIYDGINLFRESDQGNNQIYMFRYPPFKSLGPNMEDVLNGKDIYEFDPDEWSEYVKDINWGFDNSFTGNQQLDRKWYEDISRQEYFSKYDDDAKPLFAALNHISINPSKGYIPLKCLTKIIQPKDGVEIMEESVLISNEEFFMEAKLKSKERNKLPDSEFGIVYMSDDNPPKKIRKFPLNDEIHVKQAVNMFNRAPDKYKEQLARKILRKAKEFNLDTSGWKVIHEYLNSKKGE